MRLGSRDPMDPPLDPPLVQSLCKQMMAMKDSEETATAFNVSQEALVC